METTQRRTRAAGMEHPVLKDLEREPQMAAVYGHLENIAPDQRANFPHIGYTECLIRAVRLDGEKYGEAKEKLFPSAARLQAVRMLLESIRDGTRLDKPAGVESSKWNSFTSDTPKAYALDERTGDLLRLGRKSGYAVPREKIHKVLSWAHEATEHAGRDKLYRFLGKYYSVDCFPKEFVECWLAACPGHTHRAAKEPQPSPRLKVPLKNRAQAIRKQESHLHEASPGPDRLAMGLATEDPITRALLGLPEPPIEPVMEAEQAPVHQEAPEVVDPHAAMRVGWDWEWDVYIRGNTPVGQGQAIQNGPVAYPFRASDNLLQPVQQFNTAGPSTTGDWQQPALAFNSPPPAPTANWQPPAPGFSFTQPAPIPNWQQPPPEADYHAMDFDWGTGQVVLRVPAPMQVPTVAGPAMWNPHAGIDPTMLWL